MKSIYEILSGIGIEIPADKKDAFDSEWKENYRTKAEYDGAVKKRDEYKTALDTVQTKLDGFKDVDVEDLKNKVATLTTDLAAEKAARAKDAEKVEMEKNINSLFGSTDEKGEKVYDFINDITENFYRNALMEELAKDSAKGKSIEDLFKTLITDKDGKQKEGIFFDKQQAQLEQGRARFTKPLRGTGAPAGKKFSEMTLDERIALKNADPAAYERMKKGE